MPYICLCGEEISDKRFEAGYCTCLQCGEKQAGLEKIAKSKQCAPAYNKGPYQYISPGTDPASLGKKGVGEK